MRDNLKGAVAVFIIILMVVPLMLFGVDSLFTGGPGAQQEAASVNGEEITENDVQRALFMRKNQLISQFGDNLPESFLSDENLRGPVIDTLIKRSALEQAAADAGMAVAPARVNEMILSVPDFKVDGKFNQEQFRQIVGRLGYTPIGYRDQLGKDLLLNQQIAGLNATGFITDKELERLTALSQQKRDFYYLTVPLAPIQAEIEVSDEQAMAHYEENKSTFMKPEQVSVEYLELSLADLEAAVEISEEEVAAQYAQEAAAFVASTERHAAHILVESKKDGSDKAVIETIVKRLKDGEDFALVAEELSDDFGSKSEGGDLGFTSGETFPEEFENALAKLAVGQVSEPVQTDAGTHIIKLLEERGATPPSLEEDRSRIETALRQAHAEKQFFEMKQDFEDLTYNVKDLTEASEQLGLAVKDAGPFSRSGGFGIASDPKVLETVFSAELINSGITSPALELSSTQLVVLLVTDHEDPRVMEFAEVKNSIVRQLKRENAINKITEVGNELVSEVKSGKAVEELANEKGYEWQVSAGTLRSDPKVNRDILAPVFAMHKPDDAPLTEGLTLPSGDFVVVNLTKVVDGNVSELSAAEKSNLSDRLASLWGESIYSAYESLTEQAADIERY